MGLFVHEGSEGVGRRFECIWRSTQTDVLEPWFLSTIFARWPYVGWCESRNGTRRVLKGVISSLRRIQNYGKIFITFGDTAWNVQELFEKFSELTPRFSIENSVQIKKMRPRSFDFCLNVYRIPFITCKFQFWKFPNNFCTFHAVSRKVISRFSKFWILRKRMTPTFKMRPVPLQSVRTVPIGKLLKTIDENYQTMLALTHPLALVFI